MTTIDQTSEEFQAAFAEAAAGIRGEAPAPAPAEPAQSETPPAPEAKVDEPPAPAADAPPAEDEVARLRRELEEMRHRERSASQRVSAFHRKLNHAEQELARLRTTAPAAAPAAATEEEDPELKAAMEEMPEVAKLVEKLVEKRAAQRIAQVEQTVNQTVQPLRQEAEMRAAQAELSVVEKEFPNWNELVFSEPFQSWKDNLPPAMRQAWDNASTGADALAFLRMFQKDTTPAAAPAPAQASPADAKREKLAKAVGLPSRATVTQSGLPAADDFEANFAYFAAQNRRA